MVRPRVARGFVNLADAVLHQCIRPPIGACCAPGHHGYQRAFELISGQASKGPFGSPVFACAGKTDPPSRLILSQTSAGKVSITSSSAPCFALFLCSCLRSSRPGRRLSRPDTLEEAPLVEHRPGDAGELVGKRNRQHVMVQSFRRLDPRLEPVALPVLWPEL